MNTLLVETNFSSVQTLTEDVGGRKQWFIEGVFAQHSVVNRNRRVYPKHVLNESMDSYMNDYLNRGRAIGELEHPDTGAKINMDRIALKIENLREDGNAYMGKARVLNTPCGNVLSGLLEGGVEVGVSTRADGKVKPNSQGIQEVQQGLKMFAIDAVFSPSAPDAFVQGLMEGQSFVWDSMNEDVEFLETLKSDMNRATMRQLQEAKLEAFQKFLNNLRTK